MALILKKNTKHKDIRIRRQMQPIPQAASAAAASPGVISGHSGPSSTSSKPHQWKELAEQEREKKGNCVAPGTDAGGRASVAVKNSTNATFQRPYTHIHVCTRTHKSPACVNGSLLPVSQFSFLPKLTLSVRLTSILSSLVSSFFLCPSLLSFFYSLSSLPVRSFAFSSLFLSSFLALIPTLFHPCLYIVFSFSPHTSHGGSLPSILPSFPFNLIPLFLLSIPSMS